MKYPLKLIEWEDAFAGSSAWLDLSSLPEQSPLTVTSVGFEVQRNDRYVTLAQSINSENRAGALISIPCAMILREKTLSGRFR